MRKTLVKEGVWPPTGWTSLGGIQKLSGQSLVKDMHTARVRGLVYRIASDPIQSIDDPFYIHRVRVDGWEYTIQNDSSEYPILSFSVMDRFDQNIPEEYYISSIRSMSCPVEQTEKTVQRTINLFRFLVRQIDGGTVPDIDRIMRMYRLHPLQLYLKNRIKKTARRWPFSDYDYRDPTGTDY